jgi:low affinity Fe/Cu permease
MATLTSISVFFRLVRNPEARRKFDTAMDQFFTKIASRSASWMGHPLAFVVATLSVVVWAATGPLLRYSDTWQLIINTATTVLTFLAVFLIQNSQNRDGAAMQAKLDELIRAIDKARGDFVGIEHLTDAQICAIRDALERDMKDADGKDATTRPTVERLLARY